MCIQKRGRTSDEISFKGILIEYGTHVRHFCEKLLEYQVKFVEDLKVLKMSFAVNEKVRVQSSYSHIFIYNNL